MTFEEIEANTVDEDENYQMVRDEDLTSTLDPLQLGLVLIFFLLLILLQLVNFSVCISG